MNVYCIIKNKVQSCFSMQMCLKQHWSGTFLICIAIGCRVLYADNTVGISVGTSRRNDFFFSGTMTISNQVLLSIIFIYFLF